MNTVQGAKPEMQPFQKSAKESPDHYTEPILKDGESDVTPCTLFSKATFVTDQHITSASRPVTTTYDAVQYTSSDSPAALYQPLDTVTSDYTSVYTTPTGRRGPPSVEVEGKMYSIVDPIKRETDTTYETAVKEPYYM